MYPIETDTKRGALLVQAIQCRYGDTFDNNGRIEGKNGT